MRKTKIVATIGPASENLETLKELIEAGVNVMRLNFSHGTHEEHGKRISLIRKAEKEVKKTVGILLDTKGPEIRTGMVENGQIELITGEEIILTTEQITGNKRKVSITYEGLPDDVEPGAKILIDDGLLGLEVQRVEGKEIVCKILNGGILKNQKGVNVPGVKVKLPGVTEKDVSDIKFGIEQGIDFIAASFIRKAKDVLEIRKILEDNNADIQIIAKIENREGVDNVEEILQASDGIMVARGDLGVEIPAEEVPLIQKKIISMCNRAGKPVITATQMLDSMQRNPRPTRAEASDVANAIFDGTDAIMLSGETAAGKYPLEAVKTMAKIAEYTENALDYTFVLHKQRTIQQVTIPDALSQGVATIALELNAKAIITSTESGNTAKLVSKYRPKAPIIAVTPHDKVIRRLSVIWGVYPLKAIEVKSTDQMIEMAIDVSLANKLVKRGDLVVITAGVPVGESGTTNLLKVHVIGDILAKGQGIGQKIITGKAVVAKDYNDLNMKIGKDEILVTIATDREMVDLIKQAGAVITEEGGLTSHAAIVGLHSGIPVIVGVEKATEIIKDGQLITIDPLRGHIYAGKMQVL